MSYREFLAMSLAEKDWAQVIDAARASQRALLDRSEDPCPQCGLVNPEWRTQCIHHVRDDEFGLPKCEF
jgi:hypothetical protein